METTLYGVLSQEGAGPALANRRPCSNFLPPSPLLFPLSLSLPVISFSLSFLFAPTTKRSPATGSGAPPRTPIAGSGAELRPQSYFPFFLHYMLVKRMWLQRQHLCLRHKLNVKVVHIGKLIYTEFLGSKIALPLKFVALFGRTPRTCPKPAQ